MDALAKWWFAFWSVIVGCLFVQGFDLFVAVKHADPTWISFTIMGIFAITFLFVGWLTRQVHKSADAIPTAELNLSMLWYSVDLMTALGMIGTVIGFLMMLGTTLTGLQIGDTVSAQKAIGQMAIGISTALVTTLVGLICSQITKFTIVNLEQMIDEKTST